MFSARPSWGCECYCYNNFYSYYSTTTPASRTTPKHGRSSLTWLGNGMARSEARILNLKVKLLAFSCIMSANTGDSGETVVSHLGHMMKTDPVPFANEDREMHLKARNVLQITAFTTAAVTVCSKYPACPLFTPNTCQCWCWQTHVMSHIQCEGDFSKDFFLVVTFYQLAIIYIFTHI